MKRDKNNQPDSDSAPNLQQSLGMGEQLERMRNERTRDTVRRNVRGAVNVQLESAQEELLATLMIPADSPIGKKPINFRLDKTLVARLESLVDTFKGIEKTRCMEVALERLLTDLGF